MGRRIWRLAIDSRFAAPVSCSAIRKSEAAREAVRDIEHGRASGTRAERDVVEAVGERFIDAERAAEAHAAEHGELAPPLQQKANQLQEVLVPAHRDAVLRDAAKARHHA